MSRKVRGEMQERSFAALRMTTRKYEGAPLRMHRIIRKLSKVKNVQLETVATHSKVC
jgi:hypothetical protein